MHNYRGFGLKISSEIEFAELLPADFTDADVTIAIGKTPENLDGKDLVKRLFSSIKTDEYLLTVKGICKYYAGFGKTIVIEPFPGIDEHTIRLFLLGTVMAAILYQRGDIPLHSSAIVSNGKLILFTGNSGAGKSTLLARLGACGYEIFTDDICVVQKNPDSNVVVGAASYPMIKLWEDAILKLDSDAYTKDFKIRPRLPKYGQFFYDTFNLHWLPVDKIFILHPDNISDKVQVKRLTSVQAFKKLEKQAYRYQMITNTRLRSLHFSLMSQLTNDVPIYEVNRPVTGTSIDALSDTLEKLF